MEKNQAEKEYPQTWNPDFFLTTLVKKDWFELLGGLKNQGIKSQYCN